MTGEGPARTARTRRGPRTDLDTRAVLIDTAEQLFGDGSVDAVSLRSVALAAGVTTRAVSYHFATKDELVRAVIDHRSGPIAEAIAHRLRGLAHADEPVDVRDVVCAVLDPLVELLDADPVGGLRWMKVRDQLRDNAILGTDSLFLAAAGRALPQLRATELKQRVSITLLSMTTALTHSDQPEPSAPLGPRGLDRHWLSQLIEFTSAGLRGEHTPPAPGTATRPTPADTRATPSGRGRPRDQRRRTAVWAATRELLLTKGYDDLSLAEVARRADVSRPYIYENWGSKVTLVEDAIFSVPDQSSLIDEGKPFAEALTELIAAMVRIQSDPVYLSGLSGIASELYNRADLLDRVETKYTAPVRATYIRLVERGKAEGLVRPDVDGSALLDTVRGAVMMHLLVKPPRAAELIEHLRSIILPGIMIRD